MRYVKMLGLAAIAALAAMAFVGASSATAETLCEENVGHANECPVGKRVAVGENVVGLAEKAQLLGPNLEVKVDCKSEALGKLTKNEGPHIGLVVLITKLLFTPCTEASECAKAHGHVNFLLLAESLPLDVWAFDHPDIPGILKPGARLEECGFLKNVTCLYEIAGEKALLLIEGDSLKADHVPLLLSNNQIGCDHEGFWDATYLVTLDPAGNHETPLYLAALP